MIEGLVIGKMVHYVDDQGDRLGEHVAAVVTQVLPSDTDQVNLTIFRVESVEYEMETPDTCRAHLVPYSEEHAPGTWHVLGPCGIPERPTEEEIADALEASTGDSAQ